jgi:hypothetical protein
MGKAAAITQKIGTNDRLLLQAIAAPDPEPSFAAVVVQWLVIR